MICNDLSPSVLVSLSTAVSSVLITLPSHRQLLHHRFHPSQSHLATRATFRCYTKTAADSDPDAQTPASPPPVPTTSHRQPPSPVSPASPGCLTTHKSQPLPTASHRREESRRADPHTHRWSSVGREERFHVTARDHWSQQMDLRPQNGHGNSGTGIRSGDYIAM